MKARHAWRETIAEVYLLNELFVENRKTGCKLPDLIHHETRATRTTAAGRKGKGKGKGKVVGKYLDYATRHDPKVLEHAQWSGHYILRTRLGYLSM